MASNVSAPGGRRFVFPWLTAMWFAGLVTAVAIAASALIVLTALALLGFPTIPAIPTLVTTGVGIAVVGFVLHVLCLVASPAQSRWGLARRAVVVSYAAVTITVAFLVTSGPPALWWTVFAVALFTVTGAFLVPAAAAALCAPLLGPRFRPGRRPPAIGRHSAADAPTTAESDLQASGDARARPRHPGTPP